LSTTNSPRDGEYEAAAQKANSVLGNAGITDHIRANCWYLLGSVDLGTGGSDAALIDLRKADELYAAGGEKNRDRAGLPDRSLPTPRGRT